MLRSPLTSLIGRETDVQRVADLLRDRTVRLLTLTGPGGVGKTRLALRVAELTGEQFPDGIVVVDLSTIQEPDGMLPRIAGALGAWQIGQASPLDLTVGETGDRRLLRLLDNMEQIAAGAPALLDLLARCSNLSVLATSRSPLNVSSEQIFPVKPLPVPEPAALPTADLVGSAPSVELFVSRAKAGKPDFTLTDQNAADVLKICRHLDGLPLAIELAAARLRLLSPRSLASQLDRALTLLTGGPRDLPARQRTIRDTIAWNYDLLDPDEQVLFRALSVFPGGFTLEAATSLIDRLPSTSRRLESSPLLDGISSLVDSSLLLQEEAATGEIRFRLLATVREFGLDHLARDTAENARVRNAHADRCLEVIQPEICGWFGTVSGQWLDLVERESANLEAALFWSFGDGDALTGLNLVASASGYWLVRGHFAQSQHWLDIAMSAKDHLASNIPPDLQVTITFAALTAMAWLGRFERAIELATAELQRARLVSDPPAQMIALRTLSFIADYKRDFDDARRIAEEAVAIGRRHPGDRAFPWALQRLGLVVLVLGDIDRETTLNEEALDRFRAIDHSVGIAYSTGNLALFAQMRGDRPQSAKYFADSVSIHLELRDPWGTADEIGCIAEFAAAGGDALSAAALLGASSNAYSTSHTTPQPYNAESQMRAAELARFDLGEGAYRRAFEDGARLSLSEALEFASTIAGQAIKDADAPSVRNNSGLSSRELEVLRLIVLGRTDQQIADSLFVSRRTVNTHVAHILAKLGAGSRTEAAAEAVRRKLV